MASTLVLLASTMVAAVGCADDVQEPQAGGASGGGGSGGDGTPVPCDASEQVELDGTWAALARYSLGLSSQQGGVVTMCPEDQSAPASLLLLLDLQATESGVSASVIPCDLTLPGVSAMVGECRPDEGNLLTVEIPIPALLKQSLGNIPPVVVSATRGSLAPDGALAFNLMRFTWGTRQDTLPSWQSDRAGCGMSDSDVGRSTVCEESCVERCSDIIDDDGDGYPGVSVNVCGTTQDDISAGVSCNAEEPTVPGVTLQGKVAMAFRTELTFAGVAKSSCEATGTFASDTTYAVVGADAYLTNTQVSVASALQSLPLFEGDADASIWRMVRVDGLHGGPDWALSGDAATRCAVARSHRNELE
jgi:hypothetical protein